MSFFDSEFSNDEEFELPEEKVERALDPDALADTLLANGKMTMQGPFQVGYSYEWRDSFDVVSRFDTLRLIEPTNSRYWLTITSIEGCKATDSLYVYEEFCCEKYLDENEIFIFAPNVFSPNMDGINDVWGIYGDPLVTIENISIFDRLGTLLYKGEDFNLPNENIWDGYYRGKLLNPQVLVFDIEARVGDCIIKRKGDITIVN